MEVLFYDRKNKRQVKASELVRIKLVAELIQGDRQESDLLKGDLAKLFGSKWPDPSLLGWYEHWLGDIGYKSEKCPGYQNWDMFCMESDLVFLGLV